MTRPCCLAPLLRLPVCYNAASMSVENLRSLRHCGGLNGQEGPHSVPSAGSGLPGALDSVPTSHGYISCAPAVQSESFPWAWRVIQ